MASAVFGLFNRNTFIYFLCIQDNDVVLEMKKGQHVACREGWYDNLTRTIFSLSEVDNISEEGDKLEENYRAALDDLEQEFEREKEEALEIGMLCYLTHK